MIGQSAESHEFHLKLAVTLKGNLGKIWYVCKLFYPMPTYCIPSILEILPSLEKIDSALWGTVQNDIQIKIS